jgi:Stress responsive A/B Barrel Domain
VSVIHVVAWSFKGATPESERHAVNDGLARGEAIPQARTFALGENKSTARANGFTHLYVASFDDRAALAAFQKDPLHAPWSPRLVDAAEQLLVLDLECSASDAPRAGVRGLRHVVAWSFREGTTEEEKRAVVEGLQRQREVRPAHSFAAGANLGLSARALGHTHLHVSTFDDFDGLEEFRSDTVIHAPAGKRMQASADQITALDVVD